MEVVLGEKAFAGGRRWERACGYGRVCGHGTCVFVISGVEGIGFFVFFFSSSFFCIFCFLLFYSFLFFLSFFFPLVEVTLFFSFDSSHLRAFSSFVCFAPSVLFVEINKNAHI